MVQTTDITVHHYLLVWITIYEITFNLQQNAQKEINQSVTLLESREHPKGGGEKKKRRQCYD